MKDIKTKESIKDIKALDKAAGRGGGGELLKLRNVLK